MKVLYSWLREFLKTDRSAEELLPVFERMGIEVEDFQDLAEPYRGHLVVGEIVALEPHPRADRLLVARVSIGTDTLQMVSGAPNLHTGMKVVVALPGACLPGGTVETRTFRGVESQGMLLSEAELGLEEESFGLAELPPEARPGSEPFAYLNLNDWLFDLYIMPNRGDLMGVLGVARELAASLGVPVQVPEIQVSETEMPYEVEILDAEGCPRYTARVIRGVKVWPSPPWLRRRLHLVGLRAINNIVDVTNYVLLELGHPLHAFDLARLKGGIRVRRAREGERIVTLDGTERTLSPEVLVIADHERPVALAGVMGAEDTGVSESTTDILLESAYFDPVVTYYSAKAVGLDTESSRRFIRGVDPEMPPYASLRATQLILETAGGTAGHLVDVYPRPLERRTIPTSGRRIGEILGVPVADGDLTETLPRLGFEVRQEDSRIVVTVPSWRRDIFEEPDLAEEHAKLLGYDAIPGTVETSGSFLGKGQLSYLWLKRYLVALGLVESETVEFTSPQYLEAFEAANRAVRIANPLGAEYSVLRTTLLPGLLQVLSLNLRRGVQGMVTFELGKVFFWRSAEELPEEPYHLAVALAGRSPEHWAGRERELDYYDLKGILDRLMADFGLAYRLEERPRRFATQAADIVLQPEGRTIGFVAILNRATARLFDLKVPVYLMELEASVFRPVVRQPEILQYPPVKRDLSLLVPETVRYQDIAGVLRQTPTRYLRTFWPIDLYQGDPLPAGTRSVTLRLVFVNPRGTLSQDEVQQDVDALIQAVEQQGWKIRGL